MICLEGSVPMRKAFGWPGGTDYGLPRFSDVKFEARCLYLQPHIPGEFRLSGSCMCRVGEGGAL